VLSFFFQNSDPTSTTILATLLLSSHRKQASVDKLGKQQTTSHQSFFPEVLKMCHKSEREVFWVVPSYWLHPEHIAAQAGAKINSLTSYFEVHLIIYLELLLNL